MRFEKFGNFFWQFRRISLNFFFFKFSENLKKDFKYWKIRVIFTKIGKILGKLENSQNLFFVEKNPKNAEIFLRKFEKIFQEILKCGKILTKLQIIQDKFYEISQNSGNFFGNFRICEIRLLR